MGESEVGELLERVYRRPRQLLKDEKLCTGDPHLLLGGAIGQSQRSDYPTESFERQRRARLRTAAEVAWIDFKG